MKAEDLKTKSEDELHKLLLETRKDQMNMRFQKKNGTLENTADVRKKRRLVARIKTMMNAPKVEKKAPAKKAAPKKTEAKKKSA